MTTPTLKLIAVFLALLLCAPFSYAHHSFSSTFKLDETNTIEGVITEFRFRNPHVLIYLDVTNADGSVTNWMVEGSAATGWRRAGWTDDSLSVGSGLRVMGNSTIDGSPMLSIMEMHLINPTTKAVIAALSPTENPAAAMGTGAAVAAAPQAELTFIPLHLPSGEPNFTGTTSQVPALSTRGGPDGNDAPLPYNELGAKAAAEWIMENDPQVFCDPPGLVRQAGYTPYGAIITQYPDHVTFEYEEYGTRRAVFFDDKLPKPGVPSHMGDSVARYEGDSLVIETVNLLPNASGHRGRPISGEIRVVEVYTRVDDPRYGSLVRTETTVHDPLYLTEPWTISRTKAYSAGYEFIENECEPPLRPRPANVWQQVEWPSSN